MRLVLALVLLLSSASIFGQIQHGGTPWSYQSAGVMNPVLVEMEPVDVAALIEQDGTDFAKGQALRFGKDLDVNLNMHNSGQWTTLANGDRIWQLGIRSEGAYSLNLIFSKFLMPEGGRMYVYTADRNYLIGSFTQSNNKDHGKFSTTVLPGDEIVIEYNEPAQVAGQGFIAVSKVIHAYRNFFFKQQEGGNRGFNDSGSCNNDVACPESAGWENEINATLLYLLSNNTSVCSGAMVNNVREDKTPYFLSANHCYSSDFSTWIFLFNYQSPQCSPRQNGPTNQTVSGSQLRARRSDSDFALYQLSAQPPASYNVHYAGWSAVDVPATSAVGIHHPSGDVKKISFDNNSLISDGYFGGSGNSHWRVNAWDDGTTEGGSSGSPIFDQNHRIVGQLHGGGASCWNPNGDDYYGKFSMSWDAGSSSATRLKDWLDPDNTGTTVLDGYIEAIPPTAAITLLNGTEYCVGDTVKISSYGAGADSWIWTFGDTSKTSSSDEDPGVLIYDNPGSYLIELFTYNSYGSDMDTITITVNGPEYFMNVTSLSAVGAADGVARVIVTGNSSYSFNWEDGTSTATNSDLAAGTYYVTITDNITNCSKIDSVEIKYDPAAALMPFDNGQPDINIFPVPANEQLHVMVDQDEPFQVELLDQLGRVILADEHALGSTSLNVAGISSGVYFTRVTTNNEFTIKRIIIQ